MPGTASRRWLGFAYQIRTVWLPASSDVGEVGLSTPGRSGSPSLACSTTVPVNGASDPVSPPTAASNCAAVRTGSTGLAWADGTSAAAMTAPVTASAPAGTAQRARRENFGSLIVTPHPLSG